jgi:DNA (cytosine-5)-methyltransferase 1
MPRLLDLFCGAGGAAMGYHRAGFEVVGVDINRQPHYPFQFVQADAMTFPLDGFDVIHASPPCQSYSRATRNLWGAERADAHPDLLAPTRDRLAGSGLPYIIENVEGAPIRASIMLCGTMFGLNIRKHRWCETSFDLLLAPASCGDHRNLYNPWKGGPGVRSADKFREAQGTPWIPGEGGSSRKTAVRTGGDCSDAIPPAYTEWIGRQLIRAIEVAA